MSQIVTILPSGGYLINTNWFTSEKTDLNAEVFLFSESTPIIYDSDKDLITIGEIEIDTVGPVEIKEIIDFDLFRSPAIEEAERDYWESTLD